MNAPFEDVESGVAFAASLAQSYINGGGSVIDLFAAFAGVVLSENESLGLRCLEATDRWINGRPVSAKP
jgi:hypothetical protein